jgi:hypothetical protein
MQEQEQDRIQLDKKGFGTKNKDDVLFKGVGLDGVVRLYVILVKG